MAVKFLTSHHLYIAYLFSFLCNSHNAKVLEKILEDQEGLLKEEFKLTWERKIGQAWEDMFSTEVTTKASMY